MAQSHGFLIALANPTDGVPAGRYGYYSDGNQHIAAATVTPTGRRLFEEVNGDAVSSNILPHLLSLTNQP